VVKGGGVVGVAGLRRPGQGRQWNEFECEGQIYKLGTQGGPGALRAAEAAEGARRRTDSAIEAPQTAGRV
jgi:hypothetical protein